MKGVWMDMLKLLLPVLGLGLLGYALYKLFKSEKQVAKTNSRAMSIDYYTEFQNKIKMIQKETLDKALAYYLLRKAMDNYVITDSEKYIFERYGEEHSLPSIDWNKEFPINLPYHASISNYMEKYIESMEYDYDRNNDVFDVFLNMVVETAQKKAEREFVDILAKIEEYRKTTN